jgi:hypothetical protein
MYKTTFEEQRHIHGRENDRPEARARCDDGPSESEELML